MPYENDCCPQVTCWEEGQEALSPSDPGTSQSTTCEACDSNVESCNQSEAEAGSNAEASPEGETDLPSEGGEDVQPEGGEDVQPESGSEAQSNAVSEDSADVGEAEFPPRRKRRTIVVEDPVAVIEWILGKFSVESLKDKPPFILFRTREFLAGPDLEHSLKLLVDLINKGVLYFYETPNTYVLAVSYKAEDYQQVPVDCLRLVNLRKLLGKAFNELLADCSEAIHISD